MDGEEQCDELRDDGEAVRVRLYVDTDAALARVLNVSAPAVRKAAEWGKIERESDGRWEVFRVLDGWRANTNPYLQRPSGARRPWLDPDRPLTEALVTEIIRRTRNAGGTVLGKMPDSADGAVDALVDELVEAAASARRWDCEVARQDIPRHRRYGFDVAEAQAAVAAVPQAADWLLFGWLEGAAWVPRWGDDPGDRECRREIVACVLGWLVALRRARQIVRA